MKNNNGVVYISHGKESSPWGTKMIALADVAKARGFEVVIPDYSDLSDPDERVERLVGLINRAGSAPTVLAGSSMGGYVSTVASSVIKPAGLFLLAPAFYLAGYKEQAPMPDSARTFVIHGWHDDAVPVENSISFARKFDAELLLLNSNHRLIDQLPCIEKVFASFLDEVLSLTKISTCESGRLSWKQIVNPVTDQIDVNEGSMDACLHWLQRVWNRLEVQGLTAYGSNGEKLAVITRLVVLVDFFREFSWGTGRGYSWDEYAENEPEPRGIRFLNSAFPGWESCVDDGQVAEFFPASDNLRQILARATKEVCRAIQAEFGSVEWITKTLLATLEHEWHGIDSEEYLSDPDVEPNPLAVEQSEGYVAIFDWVQLKLAPDMF